MSLALAGAWFLGPWMDGVTPTVRWGLLSGALAVAVVAAWEYEKISRQSQQAVRSMFNSLCTMNQSESQSGFSSSMLPSLKPNDPWHPVLKRVTDCLVSCTEQVEQADHGRAALEIRAHLAMQRCENLEAIIAGLREPVLAIDEYDDVLIANSSAEQLLNFDSQSTEEKALSHLVQCQALVDLLLDTRRRRTDTTRTTEFQISDKDGDSRWYNVTAQRITPRTDSDDGGESHGAVAMLRDISSQKAVQQRNAEFCFGSQSRDENAPVRHQGICRVAFRWRRRR